MEKEKEIKYINVVKTLKLIKKEFKLLSKVLFTFKFMKLIKKKS